ncbi:zinc-binding dehydrogenase [Arthrobacter sp. NPDC058097]|uniref:zinc-binding dehydrogenase n=1 Tax=Arthrobacter sp. NPDC058097 TaxID=3346340 RepID=UPI0036D95803
MTTATDTPASGPQTGSRDVTTAAVFRGVEVGLSIEQVTLEPLLPSEVRLRIAACGACHSDVHKLRGHGLVPAPNVFGHEISGVVTAVGGDVKAIAVGDRVVCSFLVPCGSCAACRRGDEDECGPFRSHMQNAGTRFNGSPRMRTLDGQPLRTSGVGGLAREITLPATAVFPLPAAWPTSVPLSDAAVLGCAGLTAYGAVHEAAKLQPGESVLVLGGGGVGLCTAALSRHAGARHVVGTDMKPEAREALIAFGASAAIAPNAADFTEQTEAAFDGRRPDVVFDTIGVPETLRQAMAHVAVGGRVVVTGLGGTNGPAAIDDLTVFVRRKISLIGSYAAVPSRDMPRLLEDVAAGALNPSQLVSARYQFTQAAKAYEDVAAGRVTGRALILGS